MRRRAAVGCLSSVILTLPGCWTDRYHEFLLPEGTDPGEAARLVRHPEPVEATARWSVILMVVRVPWCEPTFDDALREAMAQVPGTVALADVEIERHDERSPLGIVVLSRWWRVRGTPLLEPGPAAADGSRAPE